MINILITGGCGFVGSNLALFLNNESETYNITVIDNYSRKGCNYRAKNLREDNINIIEGDINDERVFNEIENCDIVIACAAESSAVAGFTESGAKNIIHSNISGTIATINFCRRTESKLIFFSSNRVYPYKTLSQKSIKEASNKFELEHPIGISEDFNLNGAKTLYGTSKYTSELIIQEYSEFHGLNSIINRFGVISGEGQLGSEEQGFVSLWLARHYFKGSLKYIGYSGSGKQCRDILSVKDVCELVKKQINEKKHRQGEVFNAGGGINNTISLKELSLKCEKITGNKIKIDKVYENRLGDVPIIYFSNEKIKTEFNWEPKIQIDELLQELLLWIKKNESQLKPFFIT